MVGNQETGFAKEKTLVVTLVKKKSHFIQLLMRSSKVVLIDMYQLLLTVAIVENGVSY